MRTVTPAVAIRAADKNVAQKLHFDLFKPGAATALALAFARIETEGAGFQPALASQFGLREEFADSIERADINGRIGSRGFAQRGSIRSW